MLCLSILIWVGIVGTLIIFIGKNVYQFLGNDDV